MKNYKFIYRNSNTYAKCILLLLILLPHNSYAESNVIKNMTNSISTVYTTSRSCEKTIAPGPQEYIELISDYFVKLYPEGVGYWVIPTNVNIISDPMTCIRLMQTKLLMYTNALIDYRNHYPNRPSPPILISYKWDQFYLKPQEIEPVRSYTPEKKKTIKNDIKNKFSSDKENLL